MVLHKHGLASASRKNCAYYVEKNMGKNIKHLVVTFARKVEKKNDRQNGEKWEKNLRKKYGKKLRKKSRKKYGKKSRKKITKKVPAKL